MNRDKISYLNMSSSTKMPPVSPFVYEKEIEHEEMSESNRQFVITQGRYLRPETARDIESEQEDAEFGDASPHEIKEKRTSNKRPI